MKTGPKPIPVPERFWPKVDVGTPDECWLWTATRFGNGYGSFRIGSLSDGSRRKVPAHRMAYELEVGPIPPSSVVCHRCDTPLCCNPDHLFVGDQADNMADMTSKGRRFHVLTGVQTREIQSLSRAGWQRSDIAAAYGVSSTHIGRLATAAGR